MLAIQVIMCQHGVSGPHGVGVESAFRELKLLRSLPQHDRIRGTLHPTANIRKRADELLGAFKRPEVDLLP